MTLRFTGCTAGTPGIAPSTGVAMSLSFTGCPASTLGRNPCLGLAATLVACVADPMATWDAYNWPSVVRLAIELRRLGNRAFGVGAMQQPIASTSLGTAIFYRWKSPHSNFALVPEGLLEVIPSAARPVTDSPCRVSGRSHTIERILPTYICRQMPSTTVAQRDLALLAAWLRKNNLK